VIEKWNTRTKHERVYSRSNSYILPKNNSILYLHNIST